MNPDSGSFSDAAAGGGNLPRPGGAGDIPSSVPSAAQSAAIPAQPSTAAPVRPAYGWRYTFSSLEVRDFRLLWVGTVLMVASFQMQFIAQGFWVYNITSSAKILSLVSASAALPILGLSLVGGAVADRVERKRLILMAQVLSTLLALFVAIAITSGFLRWQHLVVVAMVQGVAWSFNAPARQAFLPQLVGREKLGNAIALISAGMGASSLVAPAIAGLLYAAVGPEGVYFTVTGVGIIAFGMTTAIRASSRVNQGKRGRVTADIGEGLTYLWNNRLVRMLLIVGVAFLLLASPTQFLLPVFVVDVYGREAEAYGLLVSMVGLGALIGTLLVASNAGRKRGHMLLMAAFASGASLMVLASVPFYLAAMGVLVVLGLANGIQWSLNQILVMEQVDDEHRGRVMGVLMMNFGLMPLALVPAGLAIDLVGPRLLVGFLAVALLVLASVVATTQRWLRELQ